MVFTRRFALCLPLLLLAACSGEDEVNAPPMPAPSAVTDLVVDSGAAGSLVLSWTSPGLPAGASGTISYELRHCAPGEEDGPFEAWAELAAPAGDPGAGLDHRHTVTGLTADRTYLFRLRSRVSGGDWSPVSNTIIATAAVDHDQTRPAPMTEVRQWGGTIESATVGWATAGDDSIYGQAADYEVRHHATETDWEAMDVLAASFTAASQPGWWQVIIEGLVEDATYQVRVQAVDDEGLRSAPSAVLTVQASAMRTWYVNVEGTGDAPTIEAATDAAGPGDLILVGPGRYTWDDQGTGDVAFGLVHVRQNNVGWEIRSLEGPEATILDSQGKGPVFHIAGAVLGPGHEVPLWPGITVDGFTFTGGEATGRPSELGEAYAGGGLTIHLSNAVIRNCIVTGNRASHGGGIWYGGQGIPVIENCVVTDNRAIYNAAHATEDGNASGLGGGVALINSSFTVTLRNTVISGNEADRSGGGLWIGNVLADVSDMTIRGNEGDYGGGVWLSSLHDGSRLTDCLIAGNDGSSQGGAVWGSYLGTTTVLERCTLAGNHGSLGAALWLVNGSVLELESCLLAENSGGTAIRTQSGGGVSARCCDLWGHDGGNTWPPVFTDEGGNFERDPLFCNLNDFTLRAGSPCLPGNHPDGTDCGGIGARGQGCQ